MHKKVIIVFWGHPLYDGRCMNMLNQLNEQGYQISVLGVGSKKETFNYQKAQIELTESELLTIKDRIKNWRTKDQVIDMMRYRYGRLKDQAA